MLHSFLLIGIFLGGRRTLLECTVMAYRLQNYNSQSILFVSDNIFMPFLSKIKYFGCLRRLLYCGNASKIQNQLLFCA
jgi:hypothetical protein